MLPGDSVVGLRKSSQRAKMATAEVFVHQQGAVEKQQLLAIVLPAMQGPAELPVSSAGLSQVSDTMAILGTWDQYWRF